MANETITDRLLSVRETAKFLGISTRQVHRLRGSQQICKNLVVGSLVRFRLSTLTEWLNMSCPNQKEFLAIQEAEDAKLKRDE